MTDSLTDRLRDVDARLSRLGSVVVAFSGGADSAFLLAAAVRALGPADVLAATSTSDSLAQGEWTAAHEFAVGLGVDHVSVRTDEMNRPGYRANGPDRCYHCKSALGDELTGLARERGMAFVATGTNSDDVTQPHRPGLRAAAERQIVTPLADAGLTKADVRMASHTWGLPTWDKPQAACLASRIAYGVTVEPERLARIDRAESAVRAELARRGIAIRNVRVRDLGDGDSARIEVDAERVSEVRDGSDVESVVRAAGFARAEVDPRGFRSGSLNEGLAPDRLLPGQLGRSSWDLPVVD